MKKQIEDFAKELGFDLVGFSPAQLDERYTKVFEEWIAAGHEANMSYMQKIDARRDMTKVLPGAKSVIVLAKNYHHEQPALPEGHGRIARYAHGRDYHKVIGKMLKRLEAHIISLEPSAQTKSYVDTGPLLERALAEQAGIGRIGKNGCLITPEFGSWVFLSEIVTTLDLGSNDSESRWKTGKPGNVCGNCTKCIDACPTGAIIAPGLIDSNLCISYLTIENRDKIPTALAVKIKKAQTLFGCDICQEVCPHNTARAHPTTTPPIAGDSQDLKKIAEIKSDAQFVDIFAGSPIMRAKRYGFQCNASTLDE